MLDVDVNRDLLQKALEDKKKCLEKLDGTYNMRLDMAIEYMKYFVSVYDKRKEYMYDINQYEQALDKLGVADETVCTDD